MRKALSILLAIVLVVCCSNAFASRLDYRQETGGITELFRFQSLFETAMKVYGCEINWPSGPYREDGYEVYESSIDTMDDGTVDISVYTLNSNVEYFKISGYQYSEDGGLDWMMSRMRTAGFAGFVLLYTVDGYDPEVVLDKAKKDWNVLINGLQAEMEKPDNYMQYAYVTEVSGYPAGLSLYLDGSTFVMELYVMNKNSSMWAE